MDSCYYLNLESTSKCNSARIYQSVYFRNPESRANSIEIDLCERHFREVFGWALDRMKELQFKTEQLVGRYKRDKAIANENAQREGTPTDPDLWRTRWGKVERSINELKETRGKTCMNEICGASLSGLITPLFVALCFGKSGRSGFKFYFCSMECWKKVLIRSGYRSFDKVQLIKLDKF